MKIKTRNKPKKYRFSKSVVLLPFSLPWDWSADYEKQTALKLAQRGYKVVVYLNTEASFFIKKNKSSFPSIKNLYFFKPKYILPFKRFKFIERVNQFINLKYIQWKYCHNKKIIFWFINPKFHIFIKMLPFSKTIFDCVEYYSSLDKSLDQIIKRSVKYSIKQSDYFLVDSVTLENKFSRYSPIVVPQGFDDGVVIENNKSLKDTVKIPKGKPIIGYIGGINYRLDYPLLFNLIKKNPNWNFVFIGETQFYKSEDRLISTEFWIKKLKTLNNFYLISKMPRKKLVKYMNYFSVGIVPYNTKIDFNYYSRAMKIYDYFYLDIPVVSTPILESIRLKNFIYTANNSKLFGQKIKESMENKLNIKKTDLMTMLKNNTWEQKVNAVINIIS